jgi:hypothetical protein
MMNPDKVKEFAMNIAGKRAAASAILLTYLGDELGIWPALAGAGPVNSVELADAYPAGSWDLICFFDALHDMGDPVGAAARARSSPAEGGAVMVVEPFATDWLETSIGNPVALSYYTASTIVCVPNSMAQNGAALGAQAGPRRITEVLEAAGFGTVRRALETDFNLVLEARA